MSTRIFIKIQKILAIFMLLLGFFLAFREQQSTSAIARQVDANVVNVTSSSLPALSERASGVNSRYLSAAGTASLAAATVAATSNNQQLAQSNTQNSNQNNNNNNQIEANRNFLLHQQQHQQQQQQQQQHAQQNSQQAANQNPQNQQQLLLPTQQTSGSNGQQIVNQQASPLNQQNIIPVATTSTSTNNPGPQFNNAQLTPLLSTTYTYNPLLNQFLPSELVTSSLLSQNNQNIPLQSSPYSTSSSYSLGLNPFYGSQQVQQSHRFTQQGYGNQNLNQIINQQRNFNRRNGVYNQPNRYNNNNNNNYGQTIDDDGYFQQQQQQAANGLILDQNGNNNGASNLQNEYNFANSGYLQANNNPYVDHLISPQPSSLSSSIVSSPSIVQQPSGAFSTAFSGPPSLGFEYKNDQCVAADGRHGTCYQASECIKKNGTPMGKCNGGGVAGLNSNEFSGSSYVCCLFDVTCGSFAAERFVYFRNPGYPNTFDQSQRMCRTRIGKLDKGICQFRLDMNRFDVAKPTNGNCSTDMFVVSGQNENYVIPKICGLNDGQHYYVGVDESGIITLHMMMMGYYRRNFEILITQIPCRSDYAAPAHCLQYYMGTHGTIKSFNYNDDDQHSVASSANNQQGVYDLIPSAADQLINQQLGNFQATAPPYGLQQQLPANQQLQQRQLFSNPSRFGSQVVYSSASSNPDGYPNDLDYTMCIRKESGFCSITYQLSKTDQGLQPFAIGHSFFGNDSTSGISSGWHQVSTECRDDYLLIGGVRLCSGTSNNNQYSLPTGFLETQSPPASIQFSQNGSILSSAGINSQQQQLQNHYNLLMQQLARLQQQQNASGGTNSTSTTTSITNGNNNNQQATNNLLVGGQNGSNNLDQQQAAIIQQTMLIQQQLSQLASQQQNNRYQQQPFDNNQQQFSQDLQAAIITDTTPGPFILRFVSNLARNARGFHIDYRQNPCK